MGEEGRIIYAGYAYPGWEEEAWIFGAA